MSKIEKILNKTEDLNKDDIIYLLKTDKEERNLLYKKSADVKEKYVGKKVYYRGLIEISNICSKDCLYCGIRKSNVNVERYFVSDDEILAAAKFAYESNYGSIVMQSGELKSPEFTKRISNLLREIKKNSNNKLGITLSLGEQTLETYNEWFEAGAHRYLLRIESSNKKLYYKIHPHDDKHLFEERIKALDSLREVGYHVGTGVMIGLPFQTYDNLAEDLLFMKQLDIDMCGMGPYIEHKDTPLFKESSNLLPIEERFNLALKMIAILRIIMKDINIASATALQAIDKIGREKAIMVGANIIMPNITPGTYRDSYKLYDNKPCVDENAADCKTCLEARIHITDNEIGYGEWGDSKHFKTKN